MVFMNIVRFINILGYAIITRCITKFTKVLNELNRGV